MSLGRRSLGLLGTLAVVVSACGGPVSPAPARSTPPGGTTAPSAAPTGSADLRVALDSEPTYFSYAHPDPATGWIVGLLYNGLYAVNNKLEPVPDLAAAYAATSKDGLTWTLTIKPNVTFHDGTTLKASDVVFSYKLGMSPDCTYIATGCSAIQANLADVQVVDDSTVKFVLKQKLASFAVTSLTLPVVPEKAVRDSFGRLQAGLGTVDAASVKSQLDGIDTAENDAACVGSSPPDSCSIATYVPAMESLLTRAGIALPGKAQFIAGDASTNTAAYGHALQAQLQDLYATLSSKGIDQIAAAFRLLDFQHAPVGTGPYRLVKYTTAQSVELGRNDGYFGGPEGAKVGPARVVMPIIRDATAASYALQKGDINWQTEVTAEALPALKVDPNVRIADYADASYSYIAFNLRPGHLYSDLNLRRAFSMCIDHDATVKTATAGNGVPVYANTPPASWAYNADVPKYTFDVAGARALIEQSGWTLGSDGIYTKDGKRLSSQLDVRADRPQRVAFGQLAADQLKACGIELTVNKVDYATVILPLLAYPANFDTYLGSFTTLIDPDDYSIFHSSQCVTKSNPDANNIVCWKNAAADKLLVDGRQELDQTKRKDIYRQFQVLVHDDLPYYFLWSDLAHAGLTKSVSSSTSGIDLGSPLYYWNDQSWVVRTAQ